MIKKIHQLGKLIDEIEIPGEQRRDLAVPAHVEYDQDYPGQWNFDH